MRSNAFSLVRFLDALDIDGLLPKTILYSINPGDNASLGTIASCFQTDEIINKIQHGSAWWFNDTKVGMEEQLTQLAAVGVLGNFVGMLTDSRSLLSYPRHEYFRRILCNIIGNWVENGELPRDLASLGAIVKDVSFRNALRYFKPKGVI
jgi:glucuronate isomerase